MYGQCENAVKVFNFKYFLCAKQMKEGTDYSKIENRVQAMCYEQELCDCCPGGKMLDGWQECPFRKMKAEEKPAEAPTEAEEVGEKKKKGKK